MGVGRAGMAWSGTAYIQGKYIKPAWSPPDLIKHENRKIPDVIPSGSSSNPMGAAAMTLSGRPIRHSRHQQSGLNRRVRLSWMYSHVQRRHYGPLRTRQSRHKGRRVTLAPASKGKNEHMRHQAISPLLIAGALIAISVSPATAYWQFVWKGPSGERQVSPHFTSERECKKRAQR